MAELPHRIFEKHRVAIVEHVIDPDLWRNVGFDADESPRHFVDMDAYGPPPFKELPRDFDEAHSDQWVGVAGNYQNPSRRRRCRILLRLIRTCA